MSAEKLEYNNLSRFATYYGYFTAFYFGFTSLISWNALLTAIMFFEGKLVANANISIFVPSSISIVSKFGLFISVIINTIKIYKMDRNKRVVFSSLILFVGFIVIAILISFDWSASPIGYFAALLILCITLQFSSSIYIAAFFAIYAYFPFNFILYFLNGQAFSGLFISILNIIVQAVGLEDTSAYIIYFAFSVFITFLNIFLFIKFKTSKLYQVHVNEESDRVMNNAHKEGFRKTMSEFFFVYKKIAYPATTVFLNFMVTLFIFPVLTLKIATTSKNVTWDKYFISVHCFLLFNLGDFVGRILTLYLVWPIRKIWLLMLSSVARIFILILYLFCNQKFAPKIGSETINDAYPILLMIVFGLSNGYLNSAACATSQRFVAQKYKEKANTLMVFMLSSGLTAGATLALGLEASLKR